MNMVESAPEGVTGFKRSYVGEYNTACQYGHCGLGVAHAEELQYIWGFTPKSIGKGKKLVLIINTRCWLSVFQIFLDKM